MDRRFLAALLLALGLAACAPAASVEAPALPAQDEAVASLDASENGAAVLLHRWRWQDIMSNMGRLKDAGFTALQVSPHTATCGTGGGYDPYDYQNFNSPSFGSEHDLYWLVQTTHHYGLQIYADMVMNHMCAGQYSYPRFSWNDFHHNGGITNWNDPWMMENGDLFGLADLSHESGYVRGELYNYLVKTSNLGFDGFRWDAVKHVPLWYWRDHVVNNVNAWGKYNYGEVYSADLNVLQQYADAGMAVTDYNLYDAIRAAFQYGGDLSRLDGAGFAVRNGRKALTFVENHDVGAPSNRLLAYAFLSAYPGYPLYNGDLIDDPAIRNLVWIHNHLARGNYINRHKSRDTIIFERDHSLLAGINQSGSWAHHWVATSWKNTRLHDYAGKVADKWTDANGWIEVWIPPNGYVMLAP